VQRQRRKKSLQANYRLPPELSKDFQNDLQNVLEEDGSIEAGYLQKFWLTKYCELDPASAKARRLAAITKWRSVEERNRLTCEQLSSCGYLNDPANEVAMIPLSLVLERARSVVLDAIGFAPSLDIGYAMYSGGASTSKRRPEGHPALKFLEKADSTRCAWKTFAPLLEHTMYGRHIYSSGLEPRRVDGSVLFTVPKNSDIDRVAAKEPDFNVFIQKALGNQIRFCLKRQGIDLNDQARNGELARRGSIDESLATLDLSSASDSVTIELVRQLLPTDWFYYLDAARSPVVDVDGVSHTLSMFSSMGNGFTFELESLIFWALARSVTYLTGISGSVSVYGDDIIVPTNAAPYLQHLLRCVGFIVNGDKSFVEGPFRESCGSYWHGGINVKPFFMKGPIATVTDLVKLLNQLTSWSSRVLGIVDPRYETLHVKYRAFIPEEIWGGQDVTSITSLVTGDKPRKKLVEISPKRKHGHVGGYLMWLQLTVFRKLAGVVNITGSAATGIYRVRRNTELWVSDLPIFLGRYGNQLE
jgi:hypothetical protein